MLLAWRVAILAFLFLSITLNGSPAGETSIPPEIEAAFSRFRSSALSADDQFLAGDLLEGRGPGTRGDELAMQYIAAQFAGAGLQPGAVDGTFFQKISLLGMTLDASKSSMSFVKPGTDPGAPLKFLDEFVATNPSQAESSRLDSEVVFVGHGVVAPEYRWDDYKGLDVHGKTLLMLVDDPPASPEEPDLFKGKVRTYYGRWTYKYEIGTAKGAQAVLLIHTDDAAGYPWSVVRNSWGGEGDVVRRRPGTPALECAGWVTEKVAAALCQAAGQNLEALTKAAASRDFKPIPLGYRLTGQLLTRFRAFETANVIGQLPGSDPELKAEAILYTAHHDHLGIGEPDKKGDRIYNGAIDNATGCALLLELARVWSTARPAPKRTIIFNCVAAEEQGLLGSEYYGEHPTVPAGRIALAINVDAIPELGRVRDVTMLGVERTTFLPTAERVTKALHLRIVPDQEPEQGHYYRSDHFSLAKVGIPAFSIDPGQDVIGKPPGWGKAQSDAYREHHYHQPSDEFDPSWDWSEGVQMAQLAFWLGWEAANAPSVPIWLPEDEFRAVRDKSLQALKK
jgi:Zn-dependent M28 family amino/carboxypeptidase